MHKSIDCVASFHLICELLRLERRFSRRVLCAGAEQPLVRSGLLFLRGLSRFEQTPAIPSWTCMQAPAAAAAACSRPRNGSRHRALGRARYARAAHLLDRFGRVSCGALS